MVALKAKRRNPLDLRGSTDPDVLGNDDETACPRLGSHLHVGCDLAGEAPHLPASMSASNLDEFRLLQRWLARHQR
jgi:hypothetical protein